MTTQNSKALNITLWVAQFLIGLAFLAAGVMKSSQPIEELGKSLPWVSQVPAGLVRFIGVSELLGGFGVLFPSLFRFVPHLSPLAALGIVMIMAFAMVFHIYNGEYSVLPINIFFGGVAFFIYWGRSKRLPIRPRSSVR